MSSPRGSVREATRIVLKEITATLHNSSPIHPSRRKVLLTTVNVPSFRRRILHCVFIFSVVLSKNRSDGEKSVRGMYALSRRYFSQSFVCAELIIRFQGMEAAAATIADADASHSSRPRVSFTSSSVHAADSQTGECISINKLRVSRRDLEAKINFASRHAGAFLWRAWGSTDLGE